MKQRAWFQSHQPSAKRIMDLFHRCQVLVPEPTCADDYAKCSIDGGGKMASTQEKLDWSYPMKM
jgi:hypothetical protein